MATMQELSEFMDEMCSSSFEATEQLKAKGHNPGMFVINLTEKKASSCCFNCYQCFTISADQPTLNEIKECNGQT